MKKVSLFFVLLFVCATGFAQLGTLDLKVGAESTETADQATTYYYLANNPVPSGRKLGYNRVGVTTWSLTDPATTLGWTLSKVEGKGFKITMTNTNKGTETAAIGFKVGNVGVGQPLGKTNANMVVRFEYACSDSTTWTVTFFAGINPGDPVNGAGKKITIGFPATGEGGGSIVVNVSSIFSGSVSELSNAISYIVADFGAHNIATSPVTNGSAFYVKRITIGVGANEQALPCGRTLKFENPGTEGTNGRFDFSGSAVYIDKAAASRLTLNATGGAVKIEGALPTAPLNTDNFMIRNVNTQIKEAQGYVSFKYKSDKDISWTLGAYHSGDYYPTFFPYDFPAQSTFKTMICEFNDFYKLPRTPTLYVVIRQPSEQQFTFWMDDFTLGSLDQGKIADSVLDANAPFVSDTYSTLSIGYASGDNVTNVTKALTLPTTGSNGTQIAWKSSAPEILSHTGTIAAVPAADTTITITGTITKGDVIMIKKFVVVVKAGSMPTSMGPVSATSTFQAFLQKDAVKIEMQGETSGKLYVALPDGKLIRTEIIKGIYNINRSELPKGLLIFIVNSNGKVDTKKIIL